MVAVVAERVAVDAGEARVPAARVERATRVAAARATSDPADHPDRWSGDVQPSPMSAGGDAGGMDHAIGDPLKGESLRGGMSLASRID